MARLTDKQWSEIEVRYKAGHKLRDIANEYGYNAGNITKRAKKLGWTHGKLQQELESKANHISGIIEIDNKLQQELQQNQIKVFNELAMDLSGLKYKALDVQHGMLDLINLTVQQARQVIQDNPDGLHIKTRGDNSTSYGRNTEFIKDLTAVMPVANAILGVGKPDTAVQINNNIDSNEQSNSKIVFYLPKKEI